MSGTNYGELSVLTIKMCAQQLADALDKTMFDTMKQLADPVDPALRIRQEAIRAEMSEYTTCDGRWHLLINEKSKCLQAECALIGHVWKKNAVQFGNVKGHPSCLFCGLLDRS